MADFLSPMQNPQSTAVMGPGDAAVAIAKQQLGKPYQMGGVGPDVFDCSGLIYYSYLNGPHINVGRDTTAQWNQQTTTTTVNDALKDPRPSASDLQNGDIILYFAPGNSGPNAHAKMYVGGGQTIEAPHKGAFVEYNPVDFIGDAAEPFRGVKRPVGGGGSSSTGGDSSQGSGSGNSPSGKYWTDMTGGNPKKNFVDQLKHMKDPRNNLPFSALFEGQTVPGLSSGRFRVPAFDTPKGYSAPEFTTAHLVRGGMTELIAKEFKCYFMMNPDSISIDAGIDTTMLSPFQQGPDFWKNGGYWVTNQTITFTLIFNRMYEVWQGNIPGPSDEGVRWDIRALERLLGVFDAAADTGGVVGLGTNGWGQWPAAMLPLQVVFGSSNSIQFQGAITRLQYQYSRFSADMIPVEAQADVSVMRVFIPTMSGADLVSSLVTTTGQVGPQNLSSGKPFTKR